jgi:hypothetical protein
MTLACHAMIQVEYAPKPRRARRSHSDHEADFMAKKRKFDTHLVGAEFNEETENLRLALLDKVRENNHLKS